MTNLEEALNRSIEAFRAACEIISKASDPEAEKPPQVSPDNAIWSCFYIGDNTPSNKYSQMIADILGAELRAVPRDSEITANTVFDVPDTTLDNYNFSALNLNSRKALIGLITSFYSGAAHFAKSNNISGQVAEFEFAKTCIHFSRRLSEAETSELVAAIDSDRVSLFSDEMSLRVWELAKAQEAAAISLDEDDDEDDEGEDFSFIDEDDALDFLAEFGWVRPDTEDITDE